MLHRKCFIIHPIYKWFYIFFYFTVWSFILDIVSLFFLTLLSLHIMISEFRKISFIIPCYCSEKSVYKVYDEISLEMTKLGHSNYEIIFVNDCSPDNTFDVIKSIALSDNKVISISLSKNFGQHSALMAGFNYVSGDYIVCLDDDGQTPANEVTKLLYKLENGVDIVYAHYDVKYHSFF